MSSCERCGDTGWVRIAGAEDLEPCGCKCTICGNSGWEPIPGGVTPCKCRVDKKLQWRLTQASIPEKYKQSELENYYTFWKGCTDLQKAAHFISTKFVDRAAVNSKVGLVFDGSVGGGKTHLAVGILKALIRQGRTGIFYDQNHLFHLLRQSYKSDMQFDESDILDPAMKWDVLVLDDLGALPMSDWATEKMVTILNERYNNDRITIVTTNFEYAKSKVFTDDYEERKSIAALTDAEQAQRATTHYTLGDRITNRMFSRLEAMCLRVRVYGPDYRRTTMGRAKP